MRAKKPQESNTYGNGSNADPNVIFVNNQNNVNIGYTRGNKNQKYKLKVNGDVRIDGNLSLQKDIIFDNASLSQSATLSFNPETKTLQLQIGKNPKNAYEIGRIPNVGDYKMSLQKRNHDGWLLCDGKTLYDPKDYPELANLLYDKKSGKYVFNVDGDDKKKFKLPKADGRVLGMCGKARSWHEKHELGDFIGYENHRLKADELPPHEHVLLNITGGYEFGSKTHSGDYKKRPWLTFEKNYSKKTTEKNPTTHSPFSIMQPTIYIGNLFIYAGPKKTSS